MKLLKRSLEPLVGLAGLLVYVGLAAAQIDRPGLYYDEAADAVPAVQLLAGQAVEPLRGAAIEVFGRTVPLMIFDYVGPWNTYLLIPLFAAFGTSVEVLRGLTVAAGALTVGLTYLFSRQVSGDPWVAGPATALLAVSPAFVLWTREGIHVTSILLVFSLGSLILLHRWWRTRSAWPLIGAAGLLGAGLAAKFLFLWWLLGLIAAASVAIGIPGLAARRQGLNPRRTDAAGGGRVAGGWAADPSQRSVQTGEGAVRVGVSAGGPNGAHATAAPALGSARAPTRVIEPVPSPAPIHPIEALPPAAVVVQAKPRPVRTPVWAWPIAGAAFLVGAWPLVLFNLQTGGTLDVLLRNSTTTHLGANNLDLPANLAKVADHALAAIQGGVFWYLGGPFENRLWPIALLLATVGWVALFLTRPAARRLWRRVTFLYVLGGCLIGQSAFTVSSLEPTHHLIVWPLPQLLVAWCAVAIGRSLWAARPAGWTKPVGRALAAAVGAGVLVLGVADARTTLAYHEALARTGGLATHSDAVSGLAAWLRERGYRDPIALDWGLRNSLIVLTGGQVQPVEIFMYDREPPPQFFDWLYGSLTKRPDQVYLLHADRFAVFPRRAAFESLVDRLGQTPQLEGRFRQRDGTVVYEVYSVRPR